MVKSQEQKVCEIQVVYKDFRFQSTIGFSELGAGGVFRSYFKVRIHFIEIYKDSGYLWHEQKNSTSKQYNIVFSVEYNNMHKEYSSFFAIMLFFFVFSPKPSVVSLISPNMLLIRFQLYIFSLK